jgi:hypothetical protein
MTYQFGADPFDDPWPGSGWAWADQRYPFLFSSQAQGAHSVEQLDADAGGRRVVGHGSSEYAPRYTRRCATSSRTVRSRKAKSSGT